jgi:hypothetical protein
MPIIKLFQLFTFVFIFLMSFHLLAGVPKIMDCYLRLIRQPGYVEHEVSNMGKAVSWATILSQSLDSSPQPCK